MFNPLAWWRARRKPIPPGALVDRIINLDPEVTPFYDRPITLQQYALSQLNKNRRKPNGKG